MRSRDELVRKLHSLINRLPDGLLVRLLADAQFFHDWNMGKKKARSSGRISQHNRWVEQAENKRLREYRKFQ